MTATKTSLISFGRRPRPLGRYLRLEYLESSPWPPISFKKSSKAVESKRLQTEERLSPRGRAG